MIRTLAILLFLVCVSAQAQELFRYKNEDGVLVTTDRLPPNAANGGYEVISTSGRILRVVAPLSQEAMLSDEQRADAAEQQRNDVYLLTSYSSVSEIEAQADRKLTQVRFDMRQLEGTLATMKSNEMALVDQAAELEMAGREVSADILEQLQTSRASQQQMQVRLVTRGEELERLRKHYERFVARFLELKSSQ